MKPKHVLLIPDGNRRFAKARGLSLTEGYRQAAWRIGDVAEWILKDEDIDRLTVYGLSYDNVMMRNPSELKPIEDAWTGGMKRWLSLPWMREMGVRVIVRGDVSILSDKFKRTIAKVEKTAKEAGGKTFCFLLGYSGQKDIVSSIGKLKHASHGELVGKMQVGGPIDLVIRTGNAPRLSDCPLYAVAYAEFFFMEKMFPELTREDIRKIMQEFAGRKRNFGR